jgi:hypothetical protein
MLKRILVTALVAAGLPGVSRAAAVLVNEFNAVASTQFRTAAAGEGVQPTTGINNREVWKLEADPSASITPISSYDDGSSSSFGSPNRWNGGANVQDFTALRAAVPEPGAATLLGVALAAALSARRARRAA